MTGGSLPPLLPPDPLPVSATDGPTSAAPRASPWEDALDIFYAPTQVFERRRDGKYWIPLLILVALSVAIYLLSVQYWDVVFDAEMARGFADAAKNGQKMTPEAMAAAKSIAAKFKDVGVYFTPVARILGAWIAGLMIMLLCNLMGGRLNFAQATLVGVLSDFPTLLGKVAVALQGLFLDINTVTSKYSFATSVARLLGDDANKFVLKLGAVADPFVIWGAVLLGIGVHVIGNLEKEKAAVLAIIYSIVIALLIR